MKTISKPNKNNLTASFVLAAVLLMSTFNIAMAAPGSLDPGFGTNGIINTDLGIDSVAAGDIVLTTGGKFYVSSSAQLDEYNLYAKTQIVLRYNSNGSIDPAFGVNGMVPISNVETISGGKSIILPDGKSLRCGNIGQDYAVIRYNADGTLDNSFGTNGIGTIHQSGGDITNHCADLALQPDNKIVVVGTETSQSNYNFIVIGRFNSNGTPDIAFGQRVVDRLPGNSRYNYASAVVVQTDGKIIVSGSVYDDDKVPYGPQISLTRLNNDGTYDTTFGATSTDGIIGMKGTVTTVYSRFYSTNMALQIDGKIVVIGYKTALDDADTEDFAIARFNTDGTLDTAFGDSGFVLTDFGHKDFSKDLVIQKDGRIIVVGRAERWGGNWGDYGFLMARYNTNGSTDKTFGVNGKVIGNFGSNYEFANNAILQPDGKLLVTGSVNHDMLIARYDTGPFGFSKQSPANGATDIYPASVTLTWNAVAPDPNGYGQSYKYCYYASGGSCVFSDNIFTTHATISSLNAGTTYYWQVEVVTCMDAPCNTTDVTPADNGQVWSFTTPLPATTISKQSPANGAIGVKPANVTLNWTVTAPDPFGYGQSFKYCYHTSSEPCIFSANVFTTHYVIPLLATETTYYWQVEVVTCMDVSCTTKNIKTADNNQEWSFTTSPITISGNVGVAGVTLSYTDGTARTVISGADGGYSAPVSPNWNGTIIPSKACFTFDPLNRSYSSVTVDQTAQDYTYTVTPGCLPGSGLYDDTNSNWVYSGAWTASTPGPAYNSTLHYSMTPGDTASFTFSGTSFALYYTQYSNRGNIQVFMDGSPTPLTTINASGALLWQKTYTSPMFSPGTHTVVFKHGSPSGSTIDIDAIQVFATYDDTDSNWSYGGTWTASTPGPAYNSTLHYTMTPGDTASFMFTGTGFTFYYTQYSNRGSIQVFLDGSLTPLTTINASGALLWQKSYTSPTFTSGTHTVVFKHGGPSGTTIDVDAITIAGGSAGGTPDTTPPSTVSDLAATTGTVTNGSVDLTWTAPYNDTGTPSSGPVASYLVRCSTSPIVDDPTWNAATTISANIPSPQTPGSSQAMTVTGLVSGTTYYFNIRALDAANNLSNVSNSPSAAASTISVPTTGPGIYDDTDPNWVYSGTWTASTPGPAYGSSLHYTMTPGDTASFTFSGTDFTLYYTQYTNRGNIQVFMDGSLTPLTTINANGALLWQKTYTSPTFAPGTHTVVFKDGGPSGSTIDIDAIRIFATYDDAASGWVYTGAWTASTPGPAYGSTLHYTTTPGDTASFAFSGTGFTFYYTQYPNRGNIQVFMDGSVTPLVTINASGVLLWQKTYISPTFAPGAHTVVFKHGGPSGTTIDIDAITIR